MDTVGRVAEVDRWGDLFVVSIGMLLLLAGCGGKGRESVRPEGVSLVKEQRLLALYPKDKPLQPIPGTSGWRLDDKVQVATWHPAAVNVWYRPAYSKHRWELYAHAPTTITFPAIQVGEDARVGFGWYMRSGADVKGSDGAAFRVWCATAPVGMGSRVFQTECAADGKEGARWIEVPLPVKSGESVRLTFETDPGPSGNNQADWTAWEMPVLRWRRPVKLKPNDGPNAILFTLDTLRADRLSCYGYDRETSPNIDTLASQGTVMTGAYSQTTTTVPSHISIMTSKYLEEFGIYTQSDDPLPADYRTLAECLKDAGYNTAGFLAAEFMKDAWTGLGQGFDTFVECPVGTLDGEHIVNSVIDWLADHHGERFFIWIHLFDCHVPYHPPGEFRDRFVDPQKEYPEDIKRSLLQELGDEKYERLSREYYSDRYDGGVAYTDHQVGRVVSTLRDLGVFDETLIVVAADHGESLGEHSIYFDHVSLYQPNVHVPLIFHWPGHVPTANSPELCENVDIYPTILDLLDVKTRGRLSGRSLVPVWEGAEDGRQGVLAEHVSHLAVSWRTERWTYLYQPMADEAIRAELEPGWLKGPAGQWILHANKEELYDRVADPDELSDKSDTELDVLETLQGDCAEWVNACNEAWEASGEEADSPVVDPDRLKQIRALGYVR